MWHLIMNTFSMRRKTRGQEIKPVNKTIKMLEVIFDSRILRSSCKCRACKANTEKSYTITLSRIKIEREQRCQTNTKCPLSAKCYVAMTTHLQLLFMKAISFVNETNTSRAELQRGDSSFCCVLGMFLSHAYFLKSNKVKYLVPRWLFF